MKVSEEIIDKDRIKVATSSFFRVSGEEPDSDYRRTGNFFTKQNSARHGSLDNPLLD